MFERYTEKARRVIFFARYEASQFGAVPLCALAEHIEMTARRCNESHDGPDELIGRKIAKILCGGELNHQTQVSEQYLLDLEREGFLSLCGERKTQERIAAMLKTGKPLRN